MKKKSVKKQTGKRIASLFLAALLSMSALQASFCVSAAENGVSDNKVVLTADGEESGYGNFLSSNKDNAYSDSEIVVGTGNFSASDSGAASAEVNGKQAYTLDKNNTYVEYTFTVAKAGLYNISVNYCPVEDTGRTIQVGFMLDGEYQYKELENVQLSRIWVDKKTDSGAKYEKDEDGNEVRPTQVENFRWNEVWVKSVAGTYNDPLAVSLTAGTHTLRVVRQLEAVAISNISFKKYEAPVSYEEYKKSNSDKKVITKSNYIIEAEDVLEKSDNRLASTIDSTNSGMSPQSSKVNKVNSFGQSYWNTSGQWATWQVPDNLKEGMYILRFRAKQNGSVGVSTFRTVYINGVIPFKEAASIPFEYKDSWYISTAGGDENPYMFYLKPGDILTLEATTGELGEVLGEISSSIDMLNDIYQSIIMVTGVNPDTERDYNIQREIPTLLDDLKAAKNEISKIDKMVTAILGDANSKTYFFREFADKLDGMITNYRTIVDELSTFKSEIDSYIAQTYDINSLQLELDRIYISSSDTEKPKAGAGFWKSLKFELQRFVYSFSDKYVQGEEKGKKTVTVWTALGRDQAQAVKNLIDEEYLPNHPNVNIKFVVSATSLPEAILAGRQPDISLSVAQDVPINLALRGQLLDLKPYIDKLDDEYMSQFKNSAWTPFEYEGGIYAMPITQDFNVMFYRSDILKKLGLELPQTWDDFYKVLRELQKNKFNVGIKEADAATAGVTAAAPIFNMFLLQKGGKYYNNDLTQVNFECNEGKEAFTQLVELYRDYALDTDFNILSRFRSGEMPIIIASSGYYQQISAVGTEIQGRWGMTLVPGTPKEDGTIDRTVSADCTGTIILKAAKDRGVADEAFEFVKWWASAETQENYAYAMESIQGIAGRPALANIKAFENIGWTDAEKKILTVQRDNAVGIEQIPGNYIILRHLTNALRTSYNDNADPLRQLNIQCRYINQELTRKRAEFVDNN